MPSRLRADTSVVRAAPPNNGSPSATTSNRRLSIRSLGTRSMSRTMTFVRTHAPASLQTRAAAFSNGNPSLPQNPCHGTSCGGGQGSQKDGHTGSSKWTGEGEGEGGGDEGGGTVGSQTLQVVKATKGTEAKGPAFDRISARSAEAIVGNKRCVLNSTSRQAAATLPSKPWQTRLVFHCCRVGAQSLC